MRRVMVLVLWCVVVGYVSAARFTGHEDGIWNDRQCGDLGTTSGVSTLKECMLHCKNTMGCTALNYDSDGSICNLRACALPVPKPSQYRNVTSFQGYSLVSDSGPMCIDRLESCAKRVAAGECENNISYMSDHCMASCIMFATTERKCSDKISNCGTLAARGECEDNPEYMNFNCPETCHLCDCEGFQCGNGQCIDLSQKCDDNNDCNDNSDEIECTSTACAGFQFQCGNGQCINPSYKCNGRNDCNDNSDELDCPSTACAGFQCGDGQCIAPFYICDGRNDCNDNSDEINCTCPNGSIGGRDRFFSVPLRCFVVFKDTERNWEEARRKCTAEGLSMAAQSTGDVAYKIHQQILKIHGNGTSVWLEARGDGFNFVWQHNRIGLRNDDSLLQSGHVTTEDCLYMGVGDSYYKPYASDNCSSRENLYTLCEI